MEERRWSANDATKAIVVVRNDVLLGFARKQVQDSIFMSTEIKWVDSCDADCCPEILVASSQGDDSILPTRGLACSNGSILSVVDLSASLHIGWGHKYLF